jgi:hypothetical protein
MRPSADRSKHLRMSTALLLINIIAHRHLHLSYPWRHLKGLAIIISKDPLLRTPIVFQLDHGILFSHSLEERPTYSV